MGPRLCAGFGCHAVQLGSLGPPRTCGPMKVAGVCTPTSHQATRVRRGMEELSELLAGGRGCCGEGFLTVMKKSKGKASARGSVRHRPNVTGSLWAQGRALTAVRKLEAVNPNAS